MNKCRVCGQNVNANYCPNCGAPSETEKDSFIKGLIYFISFLTPPFFNLGCHYLLAKTGNFISISGSLGVIAGGLIIGISIFSINKPKPIFYLVYVFLIGCLTTVFELPSFMRILFF